MRGIVLVAIAVVSGVTVLTAPAQQAARAKSLFLSGDRRGAPACLGGRARLTRWRVVVVVFENHSYSQVAGASPYLNQLAHGCALTVNYSAVSHPSLPNYLALTSGSTNGITTDCTGCLLSARSIFEQLDGGWRSYLESMPQPGYLGAFSGLYAKKHNPAAYYTDIAHEYARQALPLGSAESGALAGDLRQRKLKRFSLVIPNLCNDEHDCPITVGDHWLHTWIPLILRSPAYKSGQTVLFITYDEGNGSDHRVYTVAVSPSIQPGTIIHTPLSHYSLLKTIQQLLGLPCLAHSCDATVHSMLPSLHLRVPATQTSH